MNNLENLENLENTEKEFLEDDEGTEIVDLDGEPFEVIGEMDYEGGVYFALIPYKESENEDDEDEEVEFVILKESEENGEYFLETIDDDDFYEKIGAAFLELLISDEE